MIHLSTTILHILCQLTLFIIGTFIQIKIVSVCRREQGATWKIHVVHSIVLVINFAFNISFDAAMHFFPSVAFYTGKWICYLSSFVIYYCFYSIVANTLVVSVMKYLFIVHGITTSSEKGLKVKKRFLILSLMHPLFLAVSYILTDDWASFSSMKKCFIAASENSTEIEFDSNDIENEEKSAYCFSNIHTEIIRANPKDLFSDINFVSRLVLCIFRTIFNVAVSSNLLEVFFYYKTFRKMHR